MLCPNPVHRPRHEAVSDGAQFIVAIHSPALMALPRAVICEFDVDGAHWAEVESAQLWRTFLDAPDRFFRRLLAPEE